MEENPEKMERPRPWPDPPSAEDQIELITAAGKPNIKKADEADKKIPAEKLPEMTIPCPECNDREHRMTILLDFYPDNDHLIWCNKCGAMFKLARCNIKTKLINSCSAPFAKKKN